MNQFSLEVLFKQIHCFMCCDAFFSQKICVKGRWNIPCLIVLALWFSRDLKENWVQTFWSGHCTALSIPCSKPAWCLSLQCYSCTLSHTAGTMLLAALCAMWQLWAACRVPDSACIFSLMPHSLQRVVHALPLVTLLKGAADPAQECIIHLCVSRWINRTACWSLETTRPCHLAVKDLLKIGIVNLILTSTTPRPTTLFISFWFYAKLWKLHLPSINLQKKKRQCLVNKQNQIRNLAICLVVTNIS